MNKDSFLDNTDGLPPICNYTNDDRNLNTIEFYYLLSFRSADAESNFILLFDIIKSERKGVYATTRERVLKLKSVSSLLLKFKVIRLRYRNSGL
jgi:hypothetical protein